MTTKEFLSGKVFKVNGYGNYQFRKADDYGKHPDAYGHIAKVHFYDGQYLFDSHAANVTKVGPKNVTCYTFLFDRQVNRVIRLANCEVDEKLSAELVRIDKAAKKL